MRGLLTTAESFVRRRGITLADDSDEDDMLVGSVAAFDVPIEADQYCTLEDGHVYRIDQAQREQDADGLDINTLSLAEPEGKYELFQN